MQLRFTSDELQFLLQLAQQWDRDLTLEIGRAPSGNAKSKLEQNRRSLDELENQLIQQDLRFSVDELDLLTDLVRRGEGALSVEMAHVSDRETQRTMLGTQARLKRIHEKVSEACAMF